jgi:hypothetical protein
MSDMRRHFQQVTPVAQHAAEIGHRRLRTEAEEAEAGGFQDHPADRGRGRDHDDGQDIGEKFEGDDPRARLAAEAGGGHEVGPAQPDGGAAHGAGEKRHVDDDDGDHRVGEAGAEHCHDGERQQQIGKRHQHVDAAHEGRIDEAPVIGRENADGGADGGRDECCHDADDEAHACAPDEAREHVAPKIVGAEQRVVREGRRHAAGEIGGVGIGERENGRRQRDHRDDADQHRAEHGNTVAPELPECAGTAVDPGRRNLCGNAAHEV